MDWTEARVAELAQLWKDGLSAGQIAVRLGATRNAVLGKLKRLKLLGTRASASPPGRAPNAPRPAGAPRLALAGEPPASEPPRAAPSYPELDVPETAFAPLPGAVPRPWLQRDDGECAFPAGGDGAGLWSCCAPVKPGSPYCPAHHGRVFRAEPPAARRDAEKLLAELVRRWAA